MNLIDQGCFVKYTLPAATPDLAQLPAFLRAKNLEPFISNELATSSTPVVFETERRGGAGGGKALGYRAQLLPDVCWVYAKAKMAGKLLPSQQHIAEAMADVFDVARYILARLGEAGKLPITTWKLQKLVYYSQAWSAVWSEQPLFSERIEAWANGPVCPDLYGVHRGQFQISALAFGDESALTDDERENINIVLEHYGAKPSQYLSELTHMERPWLEARGELKPGDRCSNEITVESMVEYYGSL